MEIRTRDGKVVCYWQYDRGWQSSLPLSDEDGRYAMGFMLDEPPFGKRYRAEHVARLLCKDKGWECWEFRKQDNGSYCSERTY